MASASLTPVIWWGDRQINRNLQCSVVSAVMGGRLGSWGSRQGTRPVHWVTGRFPDEVTPPLRPEGQRWERTTTWRNQACYSWSPMAREGRGVAAEAAGLCPASSREPVGFSQRVGKDHSACGVGSGLEGAGLGAGNRHLWTVKRDPWRGPGLGRGIGVEEAG